MDGEKKTKEQLIDEVISLRKQNSELNEKIINLKITINTLLESLESNERDSVELTNNELIHDVTERKPILETLLKRHKLLEKQLFFASALNRINETIISNDDTQIILQTMAEIIGSTLNVDRSLIYDIDFDKHQLIGLCEWLNPNSTDIKATKGIYSLDIFFDGCMYMKNYRKWMESHIDDYNAYAFRDGSGDLLHNQMNIKSGLWYPFSFREQGYYCLVFNQVNFRRTWLEEEIKFIATVAQQVEIAIQKTNILIQQKQAQKALRLSEERFSKAFNYSPVSMTMCSLNTGIFIAANESCLKMHGFRKDEFIGKSDLDLKLWVDMDERARYLKDIKEKGLVLNHEIRSYKKSGEIFVAFFSGVVIELYGEKCILEIKVDITELRQCQREISRLDRLNLIGEMAAGIAHELRNPMTTVRGFLQLLGQKENYLPDKEYFNLMIDELDRANSIITEFLSLAKNKAEDLNKQNLNTIVKVIFPLIQADAMLSGKFINLDLEEIPDLLVNEKEIRQLILNLVRNALEAMHTGKYITIKTYIDGSEVVLSIQDQGIGIPSDILDKLGTPFFTTKDNGTGLGLATCYSIVKRHNANIDIKTSLKGTTFFVRFKNSA